MRLTIPRLLMVIIALLDSACGYQQDSVTSLQIKPYVELFEKIYGIKYKGSIIFSELEYPYDAVCSISIVNGNKILNDSSNIIYIDKDSWKRLELGLGREQLVFHELAHCVFGLEHDHNEVELPDGDMGPKSLMYPYTFGDDRVYENNRQFYIESIRP